MNPLSAYEMEEKEVHDSLNAKIVEQANESIKNNPMVFRPNHYTEGGIETIDFIRAKSLCYFTGNAVKYISRAKLKGKEIEDLEKAIFYLQMKVHDLKKEKEITNVG